MLSLNIQVSSNDENQPDTIFQIIDYNPNDLSHFKFLYRDYEDLLELCNEMPDEVDWYSIDNNVHGICISMQVPQNEIDLLRGKDVTYKLVDNHILPLLQRWKNKGFYYVNTTVLEHLDCISSECFINKLSRMRVSKTTMKVYISYRNEEAAWCSATLFSLPETLGSTKLGDFYIGSYQEITDEPQLKLITSCVLNENPFYIYQVDTSNIVTEVRYLSQQSLVLPSSLINSLAYNADLTGYTFEMLRSFKQQVEKELNFVKNKETTVSYPKKKSTDDKLGIRVAYPPSKEMKSYLLREAKKLAQTLLEEYGTEFFGFDILDAITRDNKKLLQNLTDANFDLFEAHAILDLASYIACTGGKVNISLYNALVARCNTLTAADLDLSLYLLAFRIMMANGILPKGVSNQYYFVGSNSGYNSRIEM